LARRDEEFARESFSRALPRFGSSEPVSWEEGTEPPDFFLNLGAERYAVEVTRIVGQIELGGRKESKRKSGALLQRFADELQVTALEQGILRGAYVLWLEPIPDFKEVAPLARAAFLDYVARTKSRGLHWSITKFHDEKTYLLATRSEGTGGRLSEIVKDFPGLVNSAVESKAAKLSAINIPHILLLVDDYHYASADLWRHGILASPCQSFHAIARVFQEFECQILYARNNAWS
jgi:hypothetical protein